MIDEEKKADLLRQLRQLIPKYVDQPLADHLVSSVEPTCIKYVLNELSLSKTRNFEPEDQKVIKLVGAYFV